MSWWYNFGRIFIHKEDEAARARPPSDEPNEDLGADSYVEMPPYARAALMERDLDSKAALLDAKIVEAEKRVLKFPGAATRGPLYRLEVAREKLEKDRDKLWRALHPPTVDRYAISDPATDLSCRRCKHDPAFKDKHEKFIRVGLCVVCEEIQNEQRREAAKPLSEVDQLVNEIGSEVRP